ncbi:outer membrane protein assembly factor BamE [Epibacterium sp. SM1969]|uniref:Outer membrane protein assembly factor BamE n=1 Tax=Tritonibacter aquimaris TaxID=2663379 RepID=A0A844AS72_9RHOB|nr:outer membrane protein assembly factor BamE [Tritonibacter aquimaris]MQY41224.1 outer membrane protein assembly factor BamE [Tritonibacter aquimaris]
MQGTKIKSALKNTALVVAIVGLAACSPIYRKHGYVPNEEALADIVPGVDTKDSVAQSVGVPSSSGVLRDSGYYYVSSLVRSRGGLEPTTVSRELVAINFDGNGTVTGIQRFGLEDGRVVPLQRRVTASNLQDKTFLRQLLGNLGNFNPGSFLGDN